MFMIIIINIIIIIIISSSINNNNNNDDNTIIIIIIIIIIIRARSRPNKQARAMRDDGGCHLSHPASQPALLQVRM